MNPEFLSLSKLCSQCCCVCCRLSEYSKAGEMVNSTEAISYPTGQAPRLIYFTFQRQLILFDTSILWETCLRCVYRIYIYGKNIQSLLTSFSTDRRERKCATKTQLGESGNHRTRCTLQLKLLSFIRWAAPPRRRCCYRRLLPLISTVRKISECIPINSYLL